MLIRKDGQETRQKILEAACRVFGEKGYRDATHAEICRIAGVNTAAINYHFGSKDALYRAAWNHAAAQVDRVYPVDGGVSSEAPVEERLRANVRSLLARRADSEKLGHFHNLRMMEIVNPTGLVDDAIAEWRQKARAYTRSLLQQLLGPGASEDDVELCEMSVVSQCLMAQRGHHKGKRKMLWRFGERDVNRLTDHIVRFCLAGIGAIREDIEKRESDRQSSLAPVEGRNVAK